LISSEILDAAQAAGGAIVTVEDNYVGGLYSEIAEAAAAVDGVSVHGLYAQRVPKSAKTAGEIFDYVGVGLDQLIQQVRSLV